MELYQELWLHYLEKNLNAEEFLRQECYRALQEISQVLKDDTLEDKACFLKIEKIIAIFESLGSGSGNRHDFG